MMPPHSLNGKLLANPTEDFSSLSAKKSRRRVQGPAARVGLLRRALTQRRSPSHSGPGVKAPAPSGRPGHEPRTESRARPGGGARGRGVRPSGRGPGDRHGVGRGAGGADRLWLDPGGPLSAVCGAGQAVADAAVPGGLAPRHRARVRAGRRRRPGRRARQRSGRSGPAGAFDPAPPGCARALSAADGGADDRPGVHGTGRQDLPALDVPHPDPAVLRVRRRRGRAGGPAALRLRRAALDALHFPKLVDRFWQNLRRCAAYDVQYFATVEAQRRLAPHLHAAIRGTIPRKIVRQVRAAT
jgi:Replication initiator protein, pSAM2